MVTQKQLEGIRLWRAAEGNRKALSALGVSQREAQFRAAESIASGELPTQILPAVRRVVSEKHLEVPKVTDQFTTRKTVQGIDVDEEVNVLTFDDQSNIPLTNMGDTFVPGGLPSIGRRERYPQIGFAASGKKIRAGKIGEAFGLDWEAIVNSRGASISLIRQGFEAFGRHAGNQEEIDVFKRLFKSSGFADGVTAAGFNLVVNGVTNPDLSDPTTIQGAIQAALNRTQTINGSTIPVAYSKFILLTTPQYAPTAQAALNVRRVTQVPARTGTGSAARSTQWESELALGADVEVVSSLWINKIWPGVGNAWMLIPVANEGGGDLPVLSSNYLEGYETPSVWIRDSNARNLGGGDVDPMVDGDFDQDAVTTKVRHVHGATLLWGEAIGYSTGANS